MSYRLAISVPFLLALASLYGYSTVRGSDPELTEDFSVPQNVLQSSLNGNFFTYTGFRHGVNTVPGQANTLKATEAEFPALQGLGISFYLMKFTPESVLAPHLHPRGSKLIYVIEGNLTVGFFDTGDKLFTQTLLKGDVYVVPKALVHYMANLEKSSEVQVLFSFSSSNPGSLMLPAGLFGSGIPDIVLEKSFQVSNKVLKKLKHPY